MNHNFSTYLYCREDVLRAEQSNTKFSPALWHRRYIEREKFSAAVHALKDRFDHNFDICEEYRLSFFSDERLELLYRVVILGKGGEIGFLFQIMISSLERTAVTPGQARGIRTEMAKRF